MNVWRLIVHHRKPELALDWIKSNLRIAVAWGNIGCIREYSYSSSQEIGEAIRKAYPELKNSGLGGASLWNFYHEMKKDDLVILGKGSAGKPPIRCCVVQVAGDYEYRAQVIADLHDYNHQRTIIFTQLDADKLWEEAGGLALGENIRWTVVRCQKLKNNINSYEITKCRQTFP